MYRRAIALFSLLFCALVLPVHAQDYSSLQWSLATIRAPQAWTVATTQGHGVTVCVVDTGITPTHPDLVGAFIPGTNTNDPLHPNNYVDDMSHGTGVAGEIAGRGVETWGVAPQSTILPVKVLGADGSGDYPGVTEGILYCVAHGANVINMSLGGGSAEYDGFKPVLDYACAHNVAIAASTGNDNKDASETDPASLAPHNPCMIAVAASDEYDRLASYSNWLGGGHTITAPGSNILLDRPSGGVGMSSGTSMAAPLVSGTLALLVGMGASAQDAVRYTLATARHPAWAKFNRYTGTNVRLGKGILDTYAAVSFYGRTHR